jgi:hypothetical protein
MIGECVAACLRWAQDKQKKQKFDREMEIGEMRHLPNETQHLIRRSRISPGGVVDVTRPEDIRREYSYNNGSCVTH